MSLKSTCGNTVAAQPCVHNSVTQYAIPFFRQPLLFLWLLLASLSAYAQDEPVYAPKGSYTDYFRYYVPGNIPALPMPAGSSNVSKGVACMVSERSRPNEYKSATAFIIQTYRNDDTLCVCTAGHVAREFFNNNSPYTGMFSYPPSPPFDIYLSYIGRSKPGTTNLNETTTGYKTPIPLSAQLVAYQEAVNDPTKPDIALFLIDARQLPAVSNYAKIGVNLTSYYHTPDQIGELYQIGHPNTMPQKITFDAAISPDASLGINMLASDFLGYPNGLGGGSSGSPFVINALPDGTNSYAGTAIAVLGSGEGIEIQPISADRALYDKLTGGADNVVATEFAAIAAEIKAHCWKNKTAAQLEQTKEYRTTVIVNNNIQPYSQSQTLNQASDLTSIASPNAYTVSEARSGASVSATYLKAATCTIGSPVFPATHTSTGKPWQINIMAKEINISPATGSAFEYSATGNAELNIGAALVETTSQTIAENSAVLHNLKNSNNTSVPGFAIWPNPSNTGRFQIAVPEDKTNEPYLVIIYETAGGRKIADGNITPGDTYPLDISSYAKGVYVASFYRNNKIIHTTWLVYQ